MTYRAATKRNRAGGAIAALAVAAGVAAVGPAPTANASCASFFGLGNTANCTSSFGSIAIATGAGAVAQAGGLLGLAISIGTNTRTYAGTPGAVPINIGNIAIDNGNHSGGNNAVEASGIGNLSVNLGGKDVFVIVRGVFSNGTNVSGSDSVVGTNGLLNWAFNAFGSLNNVGAGPGFLTISGSVGRHGATVSQAPIGININGAGFPPSAAVQQAALRNSRKPAAPKPKTAAPASGKTPTKGTAHSARG